MANAVGSKPIKNGNKSKKKSSGGGNGNGQPQRRIKEPPAQFKSAGLCTKTFFFTLLSTVVLIGTIIYVDYQPNQLTDAYTRNIPLEIRLFLENNLEQGQSMWVDLKQMSADRWQSVSLAARQWARTVQVGNATLHQLIFEQADLVTDKHTVIPRSLPPEDKEKLRQETLVTDHLMKKLKAGRDRIKALEEKLKAEEEEKSQLKQQQELLEKEIEVERERFRQAKEEEEKRTEEFKADQRRLKDRRRQQEEEELVRQQQREKEEERVERERSRLKKEAEELLQKQEEEARRICEEEERKEKEKERQKLKETEERLKKLEEEAIRLKEEERKEMQKQKGAEEGLKRQEEEAKRIEDEEKRKQSEMEEQTESKEKIKKQEEEAFKIKEEERRRQKEKRKAEAENRKLNLEAVRIRTEAEEAKKIAEEQARSMPMQLDDEAKKMDDKVKAKRLAEEEKSKLEKETMERYLLQQKQEHEAIRLEALMKQEIDDALKRPGDTSTLLKSKNVEREKAVKRQATIEEGQWFKDLNRREPQVELQHPVVERHVRQVGEVASSEPEVIIDDLSRISSEEVHVYVKPEAEMSNDLFETPEVNHNIRNKKEEDVRTADQRKDDRSTVKTQLMLHKLNYLDDEVRKARQNKYSAPELKNLLESYDRLLSTSNLGTYKPQAKLGRAHVLDLLAHEEQSNEVLEQAIEAFSELIQLRSEMPREMFRAAGSRCVELMDFRGWTTQASQVLTILAKFFDDSSEFSNQLGLHFLVSGNNKAAEKIFRKVLSAFPGDSYASVHLGFLLKSEGVARKRPALIEEGVGLLKAGLRFQDPEVLDGRFFISLADGLRRLGRQDEADKVYQDGADLKLFPSFWQRSLYNVDGLRAQPVWSINDTGLESQLTDFVVRWQEIKDEALTILHSTDHSGFEPEGENLADTGFWAQFDLFRQGRKIESNCQRAPVTCNLVDRVPAIRTNMRGQVKFSLMRAGTHACAHSGPTNCRLRAHLGLVVPLEMDQSAKAGMRVADQKLTWKEGEMIIFDDSFDHEVWNESGDRIVLILDLWHPDLDEPTRNSLSPI